MRKMYRTLVDHPKSVLGIFFLLTLVSLALQGMVQVDYDVADYLPENSPSTIAIDVMKEEFEGGILMPVSWSGMFPSQRRFAIKSSWKHVPA